MSAWKRNPDREVSYTLADFAAREGLDLPKFKASFKRLEAPKPAGLAKGSRQNLYTLRELLAWKAKA